MPSPINVSLQGYLDVFGLKNGGRNPQQPREDLSPTMDLQRWYLESRVLEVGWARTAFITADTPPGAVPINVTFPVDLSNGANVVVPQNQIWILMPGTWVGVNYVAVAGQSSEPSYRIGGGGGLGVFLPLDPLQGPPVSTATIPRSNARVLSAMHWLSPGQIVNAWQHGTSCPAASSIGYAGTLRVVRLLI